MKKKKQRRTKTPEQIANLDAEFARISVSMHKRYVIWCKIKAAEMDLTVSSVMRRALDSYANLMGEEIDDEL